MLDARLSPEALGASPRFALRLCLSPPPPLPPFFHGPPTHRTVRVLASEAEELIEVSFGLGGSLRVKEAVGPHPAGRAKGELTVETAHAPRGSPSDHLLHGHAEGRQRQGLKAEIASVFLLFPTDWDVRRSAVETNSFMESLFLLQVLQRLCVILRGVALLAATAASHGLHFLMLGRLQVLEADVRVLRSEEASCR